MGALHILAPTSSLQATFANLSFSGGGPGGLQAKCKNLEKASGFGFPGSGPGYLAMGAVDLVALYTRNAWFEISF